jgi:hypothetical protein
VAYEGEYFPSKLREQWDLTVDPQPFIWWRVNGYFPRSTDITSFDNKPVFRYEPENKLLIPYRAEYEPNPAGQPEIDRVMKNGVYLRVLYRAVPNPLGAGAGPGTGAGTGAGAGVVIWTDPGFAGQSVRLGSGRSGPAQLSGLAGRIQSIQVPAGTTVTLYENSDFSGPSLVLTQSSPDLSGWRNLVQSIEVAGTGGAGSNTGGGGTIPPPAPTYGGGGPQTSPPGTTPPAPPAPAPPGAPPPGTPPVAAPLDPNRPRGTMPAPPGAPPPLPQTRDPQAPPGYGPPGLPPLNPAQGYELYCTVFGLGVPLSVAQAAAAFAPMAVGYYLLGTRIGDERKGFGLSGPQGAVMRAAAQALPGQGPQALGMPAFVGAVTLSLQGRSIALLTAQDFAQIQGLVRA